LLKERDIQSVDRRWNEVMRSNVSIGAASEFQILPFRNVFKPLYYNKISKPIHLEKIECSFCSPNTFGDAEEKDFCDRLKDLAKIGSGCTPYQVRRAAFIFAEKRVLKHPCRYTKIADKDWFAAFLKINIFLSEFQKGYQRRGQKK
jgi:hypothetical protein